MSLTVKNIHASLPGKRQPEPGITPDLTALATPDSSNGKPVMELSFEGLDLLNSNQKRAANRNVDQAKAWLLRVFVGLGFAAFIHYLSWWIEDGRWGQLWLIPILLGAVLYWGMQMAGNWILYLFAHWTPESKPFSIPNVDVFVTAYDEPYEMVKRALVATCGMRGEHKTWLLDDGRMPHFSELARRLGAGYLTRGDQRNAKAGNVNAALGRTTGDIVVIFDVDHVPEPDFLERSLAPFADPSIGFVQVMLTFANRNESWVAKAAIETSLEFYNPTSLGADGIGGATLMGSNALIRRKALESIGGYQPGLAEDLATSISLHAAGWKSAYVAQPLAPGLAPPSFVAWFTQQLKWSRGVFELLLSDYPHLFYRLSWGQRLSYAVRMTKYWIGPAIALHLFATIGILIWGNGLVRAAFHDYLVHLAPLVLADMVIRLLAFKFFRHPNTPKTSLSRAVALVYATWPIYALAWGMALLRMPLGFKPTPKCTDGKLNPVWLLPQLLVTVLLTIGTLYTVWIENHPLSLLLFFAIVQSFLQLIFLRQWMLAEISVKAKRLQALA
jgi:cellulose synthase/poly-beta-1,6-N-acetylglucosamine synthase-like glycosyltransferase